MVSHPDFETFLRTRDEAASAYVTGDAEPLHALLTTEGEASFLSPGGGALTGPEAVAHRYCNDAGHFAPGSTSRLDVIHRESGELAFWTGFQIASVRMQGKPDPVAMTLRITEVFRREGEAWKLIHRHADMQGEET